MHMHLRSSATKPLDIFNLHIYSNHCLGLITVWRIVYIGVVFHMASFLTFVTSSAKSCLMEDKYRRPWSDAAHDARRLARAYDNCRIWTSTANISVALCAVSIPIFFHKRVKTADIGGHCLFLHKACFRRWHHIYKIRWCALRWFEDSNWLTLKLSLREV